MSVFLLASAGHSPGVTTLAVALATNSIGPALLVDANPEPDQSVLAGYLQGIDPGGRGLGGLLQAHRERRPLENELAGMTVSLGEPGHDFLPGFSSPGMATLFSTAWPDLAAALASESGLVVVDCGRIGAAGLPPALVKVSAGVLVITGSRLVDLAALRLYLPEVVEATDPERVGLVVVGPGRPYGSGEIAARFGVPVWAKIAWRPAEAEVFAAGEPPPRRLASGAFLADVRTLAGTLAERTEGHRHLIGVPS